jgi:hypothetical protein
MKANFETRASLHRLEGCSRAGASAMGRAGIDVYSPASVLPSEQKCAASGYSGNHSKVYTRV